MTLSHTEVAHNEKKVRLTRNIETDGRTTTSEIFRDPSNTQQGRSQNSNNEKTVFSVC